jgi:hypothetical protein
LDHYVPEGRAGALEPPGEPHPPVRKLHPLAYGLERIGLISLRAPITGALISPYSWPPPYSGSTASRSTIR